MLDEALRRRINAHRPHAGVGVKRVGVSAELFADFVLEQAMHENDVSPREFLPARHLLFDELAVVNDELHIEALHVAAGLALATVRLLEAALPLSKSEIRRLDRILEERSVDLSAAA